MYQMKIYGRGGQGARISGIILAVAAHKDGKFAQALQIYGAERRGAGVFCTVGIYDTYTSAPRTQGLAPDCVVILDTTLFRRFPLGSPEDMLLGLRPGAWVIINGERLNRAELQIPERYKMAAVDAFGIAARHGLGTVTVRPVNTAMMGAVTRATQVVTLESLLEAVREEAPAKKDANVAAVKEAYESTTVEEG